MYAQGLRQVPFRRRAEPKGGVAGRSLHGRSWRGILGNRTSCPCPSLWAYVCEDDVPWYGNLFLVLSPPPTTPDEKQFETGNKRD